jgi:hypothetical protein
MRDISHLIWRAKSSLAATNLFLSHPTGFLLRLVFLLYALRLLFFHYLRIVSRAALIFRHEEVFNEFDYGGSRCGHNGRLCADKKTGDATEGCCDRFAFRSIRLGFTVCWRAMHTTNHVRFSRYALNGMACSAET